MNRKRVCASFVLLAFLLCILIALNIITGSVALKPEQILRILSGRHADETAFRILWSIRLPRIAAAMILGGALSVSGFLLQTFFANPIAGPFVLGVSSGAKLAVALVMIAFLSGGMVMSSAVMIAAAFAGALLSMGFILLISRRVQSMSMLVVGGVMIGYICSAITDFAVTFADDSNIVNLHNWSQGSFSGTSWANVRDAALVVFPVMALAFIISKPMGAYQLGESYAASLGVNVKRFRFCLILLSSLLSACVTAFAGPVSFVGIAVPHLVRRLLLTERPVVMIPTCFLGGAAFCLFCDMLSRTLSAPTELGISSVTAVFGAPVVIALMLSNRKRAFQEVSQ